VFGQCPLWVKSGHSRRHYVPFCTSRELPCDCLCWKVLWRGFLNLSRDIPNSDVDLLASRNRILVRKDLHPALQYLLLEAMREVHWPAGPFNRLGEYPAEQPNDLPLSPTAEAFYRSGPTFWQRYMSFWLSSLLNRIAFFIIPVIVTLIPLIGFVPRLYRWLHVRRIDQLHRSLGNLERELAQKADVSREAEHQRRIAEIETDGRSGLRVHSKSISSDSRRICEWCKKTCVDRSPDEPACPLLAHSGHP
jgi:hypothetical protein